MRAKTFWCVYSSYEARPEDLILLYKTTYGIAQIYKINSEPYLKGQLQCEMRDMLTVDITLFANIDNPILVAEMKADTTLQKWGAVRRNFQQTIFKVSDTEWEALKALIIKKNPDLHELIVSLSKQT